MEFVERDCTVTFHGVPFTAGGSFVVGSLGLVYVGAADGSAPRGDVGPVTTWGGDVIGRYESIGHSRGFHWSRIVHYRVALLDGSRWHGKGKGHGMSLIIRRCK